MCVCLKLASNLYKENKDIRLITIIFIILSVDYAVNVNPVFNYSFRSQKKKRKEKEIMYTLHV